MAVLDTCTSGLSCNSYFSYLINTFTTDVSGSIFLTLFGIYIILYILGLMLGLPSELLLLVLLPYIFVASLLSGGWAIAFAMVAFYIGFIVAKNLW